MCSSVRCCPVAFQQAFCSTVGKYLSLVESQQFVSILSQLQVRTGLGVGGTSCVSGTQLTGARVPGSFPASSWSWELGVESTGKWGPWPSGCIAGVCDIVGGARGPDHRPEPRFHCLV